MANTMTGLSFEHVKTRQREFQERLKSGDFRDPLIKRLPNFAVAKHDHLTYDTPPTEDVEVSGKDATARFLITTMRKDRHGDIVVPQGCKTKLHQYEQNPVVFFVHERETKPIALSESIEIRDDHGIYATARFHLKTQESEDIFRLVEAKVLKCASIGFLPEFAEIMEAEEDEDLKKNEVVFQPYISFKFLEWLLLEWSVVPVPANPDCFALALSNGFGGKPLSKSVSRWLEPFAATAKVWANGFNPHLFEVPMSTHAVVEPPVETPAVEKTVTPPAVEKTVAPAVTEPTLLAHPVIANTLDILLPVGEKDGSPVYAKASDVIKLSKKKNKVFREAAEYLGELAEDESVGRTHQSAASHHHKSMMDELGEKPSPKADEDEDEDESESASVSDLLSKIQEVQGLAAKNASELQSITGFVP